MYNIAVAPFAGAWIEILGTKPLPRQTTVAPFAGAWIEIVFQIGGCHESYIVAPFAGAWIEISFLPEYLLSGIVAPFAGAWIEIADVSEKSI